MLPPSHIAYTWAALSLVQDRLGQFEDADYRLVALAAIAPDLIDKPLACVIVRTIMYQGCSPNMYRS